ncbi:MAG TPA: glycosyltransferase family 39 protein [Gammaproteobacteria bacterium]|nr:glycosyltransferase family 39 protein [Gammaproteobacteria bacterium]
MRAWVIENYLWGNKARVGYLLVAAVFLLFTLLGAKDIWTQEHRWADIVSEMFYRHDFLHPYLGGIKYYDKPLFSYWLIAFAAQLTGTLTTTTLRLPSAVAGLLAVWSIYRLGTQLRDRHLGLLAGWLLLTTFYFVFWARVSSADMLNLAGSLFAVSWYVIHREQGGFLNYTVFFLILAITSLCKGLGGLIVPLIAVFIDVILRHSWKKYLRFSLVFSLLPAIIVYLIPFIASNYWMGEGYDQNGLYLVYRENILRYFKPFDHQGSIYTYFIYLPVYLIPWVIFFVPGLLSLKTRWQSLTIDSKWIIWTLLGLFLFFTLSGSRRSYYVLPIVPFAILFTADWILSNSNGFERRLLGTVWLIIFSYLFLLMTLIIFPAWYYAQFGAERFANLLISEASKIQPWNQWNVVMLDAESKLNFYLRVPHHVKQLDIHGNRDQQSMLTLQKSWDVLGDKPNNTIFISRKRYAELLRGFFLQYRMVTLSTSSLSFILDHNPDMPIAFIPIR